MRILFVAAEVAPFAKVGGLADVAASLPRALAELGHDVRVITPDHGLVQSHLRGGERRTLTVDAFGQAETVRLVRRNTGVPVYFVASERFFGGPHVYGEPNDLYRYHFFNLVVAHLADAVDWVPDILHCNDWHTALLPFGLRNLAWHDARYRHTASVLTIHNLAYRGPDDLSDVLAQGIYYADAVSTVSPTYAREIMTPEQGHGLERLLQLRGDRVYGIVNGLDLAVYDPARDSALVTPFSAAAVEGKAENKRALQERMGLPVDPHRPLAGMVSRLDHQKGIDLVAETLEPAVTQLGLQFALLGSGDPGLQHQLEEAAARFPQSVRLVPHYDAPLGQLIYGGADLFIMPSRFEPCGLGQLIAMRYGTVPVVRRTGGLADTVTDFSWDPGNGSGFVFEPYDSAAFLEALARAVQTYHQVTPWKALRDRVMRRDFSWTASALQYQSMYAQTLASKA